MYKHKACCKLSKALNDKQYFNENNSEHAQLSSLFYNKDI